MIHTIVDELHSGESFHGNPLHHYKLNRFYLSSFNIDLVCRHPYAGTICEGDASVLCKESSSANVSLVTTSQIIEQFVLHEFHILFFLLLPRSSGRENPSFFCGDVSRSRFVLRLLQNGFEQIEYEKYLEENRPR